MFYVYAGYSSPDHCQDSDEAVCELHEFATEDDAVAFIKEFKDECADNDEISDVVLRVFSGKELRIEEYDRTTSYRLAGD